jgi:hypothetical protein
LSNPPAAASIAAIAERDGQFLAQDEIVDCLRAGPPGGCVLPAAFVSRYAETPLYSRLTGRKSPPCTTNCWTNGRRRWWRSTVPCQCVRLGSGSSACGSREAPNATDVHRDTSIYLRSRPIRQPGSAVPKKRPTLTDRPSPLSGNDAGRAFLAGQIGEYIVT